MSHHIKSEHIIKIESIDSTNNYAMNLLKEGKARNFECIWAIDQTQGKGQRGNSWQSDAGKNLTFSVIYMPVHLEADHNFTISMAVSLAVFEFLHAYVQPVQVKWPNDIYIKNRKAGGILIENTIEKQSIKSSVMGIGLNINQKKFGDNLPAATSLISNYGREIDLNEAIYTLYNLIVSYLQRVDRKEYEAIKHEYKACLLGIGENKEYRDTNGKFHGMVIGVEDSGQLVLMDIDGNQRKYNFQEVDLIR